jgi:probable rRNA maturation factor
MIVNRQRRVSVDDEDLSVFAAALARALRLPAESFAIALVSDRTIAALNRRYRHQPRATDVLSFPFERDAAAGLPPTREGRANGYLGDVVISVEAARRNARRYRHSATEEIRLLMVHGVLHLLGYDHETDRGQMNRREHALRRRLGLE